MSDIASWRRLVPGIAISAIVGAVTLVGSANLLRPLVAPASAQSQPPPSQDAPAKSKDEGNAQSESGTAVGVQKNSGPTYNGPVTITRSTTRKIAASSVTVRGNCNAVGSNNHVDCAQPAPRSLDDESISAIADALKRAGHGTIRLTSIMGDAESFKYAEQWERIFELAQWDISNSGVGQSVYSIPMDGLIISVGQAPGLVPGQQVYLSSLPPAAKSIVIALREKGIPFSVNVDKNIHDSDYTVFVVGSMPQ